MHIDDMYKVSNSVLGKMFISILKEKKTSNNKRCYLRRILIHQKVIISLDNKQLLAVCVIRKTYLGKIKCRNMTK